MISAVARKAPMSNHAVGKSFTGRGSFAFGVSGGRHDEHRLAPAHLEGVRSENCEIYTPTIQNVIPAPRVSDTSSFRCGA